jgi:hypothetical protein
MAAFAHPPVDGVCGCVRESRSPSADTEWASSRFPRVILPSLDLGCLLILKFPQDCPWWSRACLSGILLHRSELYICCHTLIPHLRLTIRLLHLITFRSRRSHGHANGAPRPASQVRTTCRVRQPPSRGGDQEQSLVVYPASEASRLPPVTEIPHVYDWGGRACVFRLRVGLAAEQHGGRRRRGDLRAGGGERSSPGQELSRGGEEATGCNQVQKRAQQGHQHCAGVLCWEAPRHVPAVGTCCPMAGRRTVVGRFEG